MMYLHYCPVLKYLCLCISPGNFSVGYSHDGEKIVTLGCDGELRIWTGLDDDDCENFQLLREDFGVECRQWVGDLMKDED